MTFTQRHFWPLLVIVIGLFFLGLLGFSLYRAAGGVSGPVTDLPPARDLPHGR